MSDKSKDEQAPQSLQAEEQAIPFLSARDIGKIYQSQAGQRQVNKQADSLSPNPDEYHWKIVESRRNLQELQKSLSNDISSENIQHVTDICDSNSADTTPETLRDPAHMRVSKQESNTSFSSDLSTSSTLSKKLLSLSDVPKPEKIPRRRSQKSKSKDSWTQESLNSRERSGSQTYQATGKNRRQRQTISGIQYCEDDVRSPTNPVKETLASGTTEKDADTHASGENTSTSVVVRQGAVRKSTGVCVNEEPSNDSISNNTSNSSAPQRNDDQIDTIAHGRTQRSDHKQFSSSVREIGSRATRMVPEKESRQSKLHSTRFNSMPRMTSKYVFKVDLDQQPDSQYSTKPMMNRYRSRRSAREYNEIKDESHSKGEIEESNIQESKK